MNSLDLKKFRRTRRQKHIRKRIKGSSERMRLTVYRSLNHIYAQIIDDTTGTTHVSASTLDSELRSSIKPEMKKIEECKLVGTVLAKRAVEKNIKSVSFDRNGYLFHGRVKALADAARAAGLEF